MARGGMGESAGQHAARVGHVGELEATPRPRHGPFFESTEPTGPVTPAPAPIRVEALIAFGGIWNRGMPPDWRPGLAIAWTRGEVLVQLDGSDGRPGEIRVWVPAEGIRRT